jgi:hypothetical protein
MEIHNKNEPLTDSVVSDRTLNIPADGNLPQKNTLNTVINRA